MLHLGSFRHARGRTCMLQEERATRERLARLVRPPRFLIPHEVLGPPRAWRLDSTNFGRRRGDN